MPELLTSKEAAEMLRLAPTTLRNWRVSGNGPGYHKIGSRVFYDKADIEHWIELRYRESTSDPGDPQ